MSSSDAEEVDLINSESAAAPAAAVSAPVKRGRCRPRRDAKVENGGAHLQKDPDSAQASSMDNGASGADKVDTDASAPRKRGCPQKDNAEVDVDAAVAIVVAPSKRGRPRKNSNGNTTKVASFVFKCKYIKPSLKMDACSQ